MLWGMTSQLNDLRSYSRHWLGEFIELYQAEECLWQPKHPDYSNNTARNNAYDKLVIKLKEVESAKADRSMVVRKINSLRSAFRRELRKINARANYETRLWYYDKLAFIADHGNPKRLIANIVPELKQQKRSISLGFDEDDSMEFEDEQQIEPNSAHSATQAEMQNETATATITAITNGDVVTIVKSENHKPGQDGHQQDLSQAQNANETATLHHHHHHQQHLHSQTQPQHTTAVKVLEITSLDSNSQREIQQAVNSLEQQHQMQQLQQQQQQQNANQSAAAQLAAQIQQQVPTIQIAREHLQPLFGGAATTTYTATTAPTTQRPNDEYDGIGINVASKLRIMSAHQRIIAEKLINDVLFNAQLDNLSVNSHLAQ
uniref:MADF domain-containing protein n=1 Tax=Glossina morsitans morsitans TaxID=37546 RepID=A0A1B0FIA7_GLOMM